MRTWERPWDRWGTGRRPALGLHRCNLHPHALTALDQAPAVLPCHPLLVPPAHGGAAPGHGARVCGGGGGRPPSRTAAMSLAAIEVCGRLNPHMLLERPQTRILRQQHRTQMLTHVAVLAVQRVLSIVSMRHWTHCHPAQNPCSPCTLTCKPAGHRLVAARAPAARGGRACEGRCDGVQQGRPCGAVRAPEGLHPHQTAGQGGRARASPTAGATGTACEASSTQRWWARRRGLLCCPLKPAAAATAAAGVAVWRQRLRDRSSPGRNSDGSGSEPGCLAQLELESKISVRLPGICQMDDPFQLWQATVASRTSGGPFGPSSVSDQLPHIRPPAPPPPTRPSPLRPWSRTWAAATRPSL